MEKKGGRKKEEEEELGGVPENVLEREKEGVIYKQTARDR